MHRPTTGIKSHGDAACIRTENETQHKKEQSGTNMQIVSTHKHRNV